MGEANTKYFQAKATIKHMNNHIAILRDEDGFERQDHQAKAVFSSELLKTEWVLPPNLRTHCFCTLYSTNHWTS